ncbi:MAG: NAD-dependent epimerase/dehydratase family protein [Promicromonosporaceae bacterium]|nr:NAD-dependent epimerase/dehydratase family protein [Promicromonosporaceae bacterium]
MRIAVAGGTGTVGRPTAAAAAAAGHDVVLLTRSAGVDLTTGSGLAAALEGVDAVIDLSNDMKAQSAKASTAFFTAVTRNLLAAERATGVGHHVAISIVGAATVDGGYYAGKAAQERLLQAQPDGWSILRATQFHELVAPLLKQGRFGPLQVVPRAVAQPVAAAEAAPVLVAAAEAGPSGLLPELAGPRPESLATLARHYLAAHHDHARVVEVPFPGRFGRGARDGTLLPGPGATLGRQTFDEWLAAQRG